MNREEETLEKLILDDFGVGREEFYGKNGSRLGSDARKLYSLIANKALRYPQKRIADRLGVEQAAVCKMIRSMRDAIDIYPSYRNRYVRILARMDIKVDNIVLF